jgi:hypothetical protein
MLRFGDLLVSNYSNDPNFNIEEIYPASVFRNICPIEKLRKWAAYVDKYLLFPKRLKRNLISRKDPLHLIHIIDHSNAIYLPKISRITQAKKIITCHDFIAIRTANGDSLRLPKLPDRVCVCRVGFIITRFADYYACDSRQTEGPRSFVPVLN